MDTQKIITVANSLNANGDPESSSLIVSKKELFLSHVYFTVGPDTEIYRFGKPSNSKCIEEKIGEQVSHYAYIYQIDDEGFTVFRYIFNKGYQHRVNFTECEFLV